MSMDADLLHSIASTGLGKLYSLSYSYSAKLDRGLLRLPRRCILPVVDQRSLVMQGCGGHECAGFLAGSVQ
jgi:hypothetical protein